MSTGAANAVISLDAQCKVCLEEIDPRAGTWQCCGCFALFHIGCIQTWATNAIRSSALLSAVLGDGPAVWHCPSCRLEHDEPSYPEQYLCYCGSTPEPDYDPWLEPHSCGNVCGRKRSSCEHSCGQRCHRGACGACPQMVAATCHCGATSTMRRCGRHVFACTAICSRRLACGHTCGLRCHEGPCPPCRVKASHPCRCERRKMVRECHEAEWSCEQECGTPLACGHHRCSQVWQVCHEGKCRPCSTSGPRRCPCGSSTVSLPCNVATPTCGGDCDKPLGCGVHKCQRKCHRGPCEECIERVTAPCRCGKRQLAKLCGQDGVCTVKCNLMRNCQRHQCKKRCCAGPPCPPCRSVCGRKLDCGKHKCSAFCHSGPCQPCPRTVDLACDCGSTVITVPCSKQAAAKLPSCVMRCRKPSECDHPHRHNHKCHSGACPDCTLPCGKPLGRCPHPCPLPCHPGKRCPPCAIVVSRSCVGGHTTRGIPCSAPALFRCEARCTVPLSCGRHLCDKACHKLSEPPSPHSPGTATPCRPCAAKCTQPRPAGCTHACDRPCHADACPACAARTTRPCFCGQASLTFECSEWLKLEAELAAGLVLSRAATTPGAGTMLTLTTGGQRRVSGAFSQLACGAKCHKPSPHCPHLCSARCHPGPCPLVDACVKKVTVRCSCGHQREIWECWRARAVESEARRGCAEGAKPAVSPLGQFLGVLPCGDGCSGVSPATGGDREAPAIGKEPAGLRPRARAAVPRALAGGAGAAGGLGSSSTAVDQAGRDRRVSLRGRSNRVGLVSLGCAVVLVVALLLWLRH